MAPGENEFDTPGLEVEADQISQELRTVLFKMFPRCRGITKEEYIIQSRGKRWKTDFLEKEILKLNFKYLRCIRPL